MKRLVFVLFLFISYLNYSQQESIYSQYTLNMTSINPSYAGLYGYTSISLFDKQQWIGIDNSPMTQSINFDTRLYKNSYMSKTRRVKKSKFKNPYGKNGIGILVYNDKNGLIGKTGLNLIYSYHLQMDNSQISFGISLSTYQFRIKTSDITTYTYSDPLVDKSRKNIFITDASIGFNYMYNNIFNIGLSTKNLFQSVIKYGDDNEFTDYQQIRQYYLVSNYMYNIDKYFSIEPSILLNFNENLNIHSDITLKGYYEKSYWLGFSYRTSQSFITMIGIRMDSFYIGYAFDYSLRNIQRISYGSHEIILIYRIGDNKTRYKWLGGF